MGDAEVVLGHRVIPVLALALDGERDDAHGDRSTDPQDNHRPRSSGRRRRAAGRGLGWERHRVGSVRVGFRKRARRRLLVTTEKEEMAMAAPAMMGLS